MRKPLIFLFLASILAACSNEKTDWTAEEIIHLSLQAQGGEEALRGVTSNYTEGTTLIYLYDTVYSSTNFKSWEKSPGKSYYVTPVTEKKYTEKRIFASNGTYSWTQNDGALAPYRQPQEEHRNTNGEDYPYLLTLEERGVKTNYIERVEEDGRTLHRVDYTSSDGNVEEVYFDASTWLIHRVRRFIETSQGRAELIKHYYDYRPVGGIVIPFRTESFFPPRELDLHLINHIEINQVVDDSIFEFPEPPTLSAAELKAFTGNFRTADNKVIRISEESGVLFVTLPDKPKVEAAVVAKNYIMFRDGVGGGSWMGNIFLKSGGAPNRRSIELLLRKDTVRAYAR